MSPTQKRALLWFYENQMYDDNEVGMRWCRWVATGFMWRTIRVLIRRGLIQENKLMTPRGFCLTALNLTEKGVRAAEKIAEYRGKAP